MKIYVQFTPEGAVSEYESGDLQQFLDTVMKDVEGQAKLCVDGVDYFFSKEDGIERVNPKAEFFTGTPDQPSTVETKVYAGGTVATGPAPLPDAPPADAPPADAPDNQG